MPFDKFFTFSQLFHMQKMFSVLVIASMMSITPTFAAEPPETLEAPVPMVTSAVSPTEEALELNAAPTVRGVAWSSLGEYSSVECSTNPAFTTNSCDQCFVGGALKVWENINGMFDNWVNNTSNMLIAHRDEQILPNMVAFGSVWTPEPSDVSKLWKYSSDITWIGTRPQFILQPGQKVRFVETDLGGRYTLTSSTKKDGELIGLLRFPVVARAVDNATGNEGSPATHYQCVSYALSAPAVVAPTPTPTPTPPSPSEVTQTATGPAETLILIIAAFFIAFGMMFSLRKRS